MTLFTAKANAFVYVPPIVLIPIAQFIALLIGGFSVSAIGIGALWSKLFGKSFKKSLIVVIFILLLICLALVVFLKIQNPDRPFF